MARLFYPHLYTIRLYINRVHYPSNEKVYAHFSFNTEKHVVCVFVYVCLADDMSRSLEVQKMYSYRRVERLFEICEKRGQ